MAVFIPAAGLGTRLRPITEIIPKEMFPVGKKPLLEHTIEQCKKAGCKRVIIALAKGELSSRIIKDYFQNGARCGMHIEYVYAPPTGIDKAFRAAKKNLENKPFLFLAGDMYITSTKLIKTLFSEFKKHPEGVLALRKEKETHRFAMAECSTKKKGTVTIKHLVEKPERDKSPSELASVGIMMLPRNFYRYFGTGKKEVQLSATLNAMFKEHPAQGMVTSEKIFDCSNIAEWVAANQYVLKASTAE